MIRRMSGGSSVGLEGISRLGEWFKRTADCGPGTPAARDGRVDGPQMHLAERQGLDLDCPCRS